MFNSLQPQVLLVSSSNSDRLVTMSKVLESCPTLTLANCSPCKLDATLDYRVVLLHLDSFTLSLGEDRSVPALGFLSFRDSERGSWSVPLSPEGREGEADLKSVSALSIHRESSGGWVYGPDSQPCLEERAALLSLLESIEQGGRPLLVLTPRTGSLELLLSALETHGLCQEWEARVQGVGSMEEILTARSLLKFSESGLSQLEELCGSPLYPPHTVPRTLYTFLETVLPSIPSSLLPHMHPLLSPYTQSVLLSSSLPHLSPHCHGVSLSTPHLLAPGAQLLAIVLLAPTARLEIDQKIEYIGFMGLQIHSQIDRLGSSLLLQVTLMNKSSRNLKLEEGKRIGLIARKGVLHWPSQDLSPLSSPSPSFPRALPTSCIPASSDQVEQLIKRKYVDTAAVRREIQKLSKQLERSQKNQLERSQKKQRDGSSKQESSLLDRYNLLKKKIQDDQLVEIGNRGTIENKLSEPNPSRMVELEECHTDEIELSPRYVVSSDEEYELETSTINQSNVPSNEARCQSTNISVVPRLAYEGNQQDVEIVGQDPIQPIVLQHMVNEAQTSQTELEKVIGETELGSSSRNGGSGTYKDVIISPLPAQLSLENVATNIPVQKIHNPVVEVVDIDDSDSEEPSPRNHVSNQFGPTDILTIDETEDSEEIQICEDVMEVQTRNTPNQQVEVLEVEDDEDTIQILPTKGTRVHFYASGCAVADPETLRQTIEAYRRKQKKSIVTADPHQSKDISECEMEILEYGQPEEEDLCCEEPKGSRGTVETTTITEEDNISHILELVPDMEEERGEQICSLIRKNNTNNDNSESHEIVTINETFAEAGKAITESVEIVAQSNKIIPTCVEIVPDTKNNVPDRKEIISDIYGQASPNKNTVTGEDEIVSIHVERKTSTENDQISLTSCESEIEMEYSKGATVVNQNKNLKDDYKIDISYSCDEGRENEGDAEKFITDSVEIAAQSNKIIPTSVELVSDSKNNVSDRKEIITDNYGTAYQNKDNDTEEDKICSIHEERTTSSEKDKIFLTSCESEIDVESFKAGKVVNQTEQLKYDSKIYLSSSSDEGKESGGEELNFTVMSEDDDLDAESLECTPDLESMVEYEKKKKIDLRMKKPRSPEESDDRSTSPQYFQIKTPIRLAAEKMTSVVLEQRPSLLEEMRKNINSALDAYAIPESDQDEAETRPNTDDESTPLPLGPPTSYIPEFRRFETKQKIKDVVMRTILMEKSQGNSTNKLEINNVVNKTPAEAAIQILNPKSVNANEQVLYGPLNKIMVNGRLSWVCDYCQKTFNLLSKILEHIKGHYLVNTFFCPFCNHSMKTKRNLSRHIKTCKSRNILEGEELEDMLYCNEEEGKGSENNQKDKGVDFITMDGGVIAKEVENQCINHNNDFGLKHESSLDISEVEDEIDVIEEKIKNSMTTFDIEKKSADCSHTSTSSDFVWSDGRKRRKRFASSGKRPGVKKPKKSPMMIKLKYVSDIQIPEIESVHYKVLAEKMTTDIAIIKYIRPVKKETKIEELNSDEDDKQEANVDREVSTFIEMCITENIPEKLAFAWDLGFDKSRPLLSQLRVVLKTLPPTRPEVVAEDLCFEFPSLLSHPNMTPLVQTYLRLLDLPFDQLHPIQRQFPDTMVTELVTQGLEELEAVVTIFRQLVIELPGALMLDWVTAVEDKMECLAQARQLDPSFSIQMFVVVALLQCLLNI